MLETVMGLVKATEFWSAIMGALVGGAIAAGVDLRARRAERTERELANKEAERALARSLLLKLMRIHSNILNIGKYIAHALVMGQGNDPNAEPWTIVQPSAYQPNPITFSAEEMGMLHNLGDNELFNRVISLDEGHNLIVGLIPIYNQRRTILTDQLTVERVDTQRSISTVNGDWQRLRPIMLDLNSIIDQAVTQSKSQVTEAAWALRDFARLANERLDLKLQVSGIASGIPEFAYSPPVSSAKPSGD